MYISVLTLQTQTSDIPENYYANNDINILRSKYDLSDVFGTGSSFYPESPVSVKEVILLYGKVAGNLINSTGLDLKQKCTKLGLDTILNSSDAMSDIQRQEYAAVLAKLFVLKMGVSLDSLSPSRNLSIKDEVNVSSKYIKPVLICLDSSILTLDEKMNFRPEEPMTRAEVVTAVVRLLKMTGDIDP